MKFAGKDVCLPPQDVIIFPRAKGQLIFHIKAADSFQPFDELMPRPQAPKMFKRGQTLENTDDPTFRAQLQQWLDRRQDWMLLTALDCSENEITWDRVVADKPDTWKEIESELRAAGLSEVEYNRLVAKIYEVNALSERAMEAARASFLLMTSMQQSEQLGSPEGEPNSL